MPISIWMKVKSCYRNTFIKNELCIDGITVNSHEPVHLPIGAYYHRLLMIVTGFTIIIHNWIILIWLRR